MELLDKNIKENKKLKFIRKDGEYYLNGDVLPINEILKYPHSIEGDEGILFLPFGINEHVFKFKSTHCFKNESSIEQINEFTMFGGVLCARFKGSNVPHQLDAIKPLDWVGRSFIEMQWMDDK